MAKKSKVNKGRLFIICVLFLLIIASVLAGAYLGVKHLRDQSNPRNKTSSKNSGQSDSSQLQDYDFVSKGAWEIHQGDLILVNNKYGYDFDQDIELVTVYSTKNAHYSVKNAEVSLAKSIMKPLNTMLEDFYNKYNNENVNVISGHRTREYQQGLFDAEVKKSGAEEAAVWIAKAGNSEHHTGLTVDFGIFKNGTASEYTGDGDYKWINDNAHKYGFIIRYRADKKDITGILYEPWHFRYVGLPHSDIITKKGFCFEEYIDYLRDYEYSKKHLEVSYEGQDYEIYFVKGTEIPVPKDSEYTISGNNVDGFIVTVKK